MAKKNASKETSSKFSITNEMKRFVEKYAEAIDHGSAAVFAGAGMSIPAGLGDWRQLLREIAEEIGLDIDVEHDLIAVAQYHVNHKLGVRNTINEKLVNEFSNKAGVTENHRILANLPIETYWTTNYDHLIEDCLREAGKNPDVKISQDQLATILHTRDAIVYKMHGDIVAAADAIVTKDDYYDYNKHRELFTTALKGDLLGKTFVFIGFSFSDPNIELVFSRLRSLIDKNVREHFCLMKSIQRRNFNSQVDFKYAENKQQHQIQDLKRFGIQVVLFEEYSHIPKILSLVADKVRRKRIFISGSAHEYGIFEENAAKTFIHELTKALLKENFKIVTGFGLGVGDAVINSVLDHVAERNSRRIDRFITMRPFPQFSTGSLELKVRWTGYRKEILKESGVAVFLFGNKLDKKNGTVVLANGMDEEFEIAFADGKPVIPIGFTGYQSKILADRLLSGPPKKWLNSDIMKRIQKLNKKPKDSNNVIRDVVALIKALPSS